MKIVVELDSNNKTSENGNYLFFGKFDEFFFKKNLEFNQNR